MLLVFVLYWSKETVGLEIKQVWLQQQFVIKFKCYFVKSVVTIILGKNGIWEAMNNGKFYVRNGEAKLNLYAKHLFNVVI